MMGGSHGCNADLQHHRRQAQEAGLPVSQRRCYIVQHVFNNNIEVLCHLWYHSPPATQGYSLPLNRIDHNPMILKI